MREVAEHHVAGTPVRPARVTVKGLGPEGRERVYTATELLARLFFPRT